MPAASCERLTPKEDEAPCKRRRLDSTDDSDNEEHQEASSSTSNEYALLPFGQHTAQADSIAEDTSNNIEVGEYIEYDEQDMHCDETVDETASEEDSVSTYSETDEESDGSMSSNASVTSAATQVDVDEDEDDDDDDLEVVESSDNEDYDSAFHDNILLLCNSYNDEANSAMYSIPDTELMPIPSAFQERIDTLPLPPSLKRYLKYQPSQAV